MAVPGSSPGIATTGKSYPVAQSPPRNRKGRPLHDLTSRTPRLGVRRVNRFKGRTFKDQAAEEVAASEPVEVVELGDVEEVLLSSERCC